MSFNSVWELIRIESSEEDLELSVRINNNERSVTLLMLDKKFQLQMVVFKNITQVSST
jgi:hypothetical protein